MSAVWCEICQQAASTGYVPCNISGCNTGVACCSLNCLTALVCTVCENTSCLAHRSNCAACGGTTCHYCARKLAGDAAIRDLNCFDAVTGHLQETEIIASCPLAATLPAPDLAVLNEFYPTIELLTYAQSRTARSRNVRPSGVQAEHFVPNSCFIAGKGRSGATVAGVGQYSEGKALTYWVDDDQKAGTEHKYLTDCERAFCKDCEDKGAYPTLAQWLDFMQFTTVQSILAHRNYVGNISGLTQVQAENKRLDAAQKAAHAVRYAMQQHFENNLKANTSAYLANGIVGGNAPPAHVSKTQRSDL
jgi:hypothetical protein